VLFKSALNWVQPTAYIEAETKSEEPPTFTNLVKR